MCVDLLAITPNQGKGTRAMRLTRGVVHACPTFSDSDSDTMIGQPQIWYQLSGCFRRDIRCSDVMSLITNDLGSIKKSFILLTLDSLPSEILR